MRHLEENKHSFMKVLLTLSLMFVILIPPLCVNAEIITEEDLENAEKPSILEKQLAKLVINVANSLIGLSGAQDVTVLVFQRPDVVDEEQSWIANTTSAERDELVFGIFPSSVFDGIATFYDEFASLLPLPIMLILVLAGLFLLFDVLRSVDNRSKIKEYLLGIILAVVLIRFGHILWDWIIFINFFIVDSIYFLLKENGINVTSFISTIWNPSNTDEVLGSPSFLVALLVACAAFMTFMKNYQYNLRIIILGVLIVLFPFVIIASVIPSRRNCLSQWFGLFTSQIAMQSADSIALGLFFYFLMDAEGKFGFWLVMVMFFGLPMITDLVQRTISGFLGEGFGGGIGTSMKNASGMSSVLGLMKLGKNLTNTKGKDSNNTAKEGKSRKSSDSNTDMSSNALNNSSIASPSNSGTYNSKGETTGKGLQTSNGLSSMNSHNPALENGISSNENQVESLNVGSSKSNSNFMSKATDTQRNEPRTTKSQLNQNKAQNKNLKGLQRSMVPVGKTMRRIGNTMAHSNGLKMGAKKASMIALAGAGYVAGTMATGNGKNGAAVGVGVGKGAARVANYGIEKGGKFTELGGEMLQSKGEGKEALALTKERLGYHHSAQLADAEEMGRMGEELIGGKTGQILGKVTGKTNYAAGKHNLSEPKKIGKVTVQAPKQLTDKFNPKQAYEIVNAKEHLQKTVLPQSEQKVVEAKQKLDQSQQQVEIAKAQVKANPNNSKYKERLKATEQHHAKMKINYETKKMNHEALKNKAAKFYENQKLIKQNESLRQNRKSSGQL